MSSMYVVATGGTGGHVFAKTLEEHNQNVARWRSIEKRLKEEAAKAAAAKDAAAEEAEGTAEEASATEGTADTATQTQ